MFSADFLNAVKTGNAYSWSNVTYDSDALDTVLTVCNDHTSLKLYIVRIDFSADAASQFVVHLPAYATWAGTAVTGTNLYAGHANVAVATAYADETGQATRGSIIGNGSCLASVESQKELFVVLSYHKAIGIDIVAAATGTLATFYGYYA